MGTIGIASRRYMKYIVLGRHEDLINGNGTSIFSITTKVYGNKINANLKMK